MPEIKLGTRSLQGIVLSTGSGFCLCGAAADSVSLTALALWGGDCLPRAASRHKRLVTKGCHVSAMVRAMQVKAIFHPQEGRMAEPKD